MKFLKLLLFVGFMFVGNVVSAQQVYITKTGEKYHKSSCHYLKNSKKEISLDQTLDLRLSACSVCKPEGKNTILGVKATSSINSKSTTSSSAASRQCTGKTKSGSRCKRLTKANDGTCYQH